MLKDSLGVFPAQETYAASGIAHCFMFYDWEKAVTPEWLEMAEVIFAEFGQSIFEGTGNFGSRQSHGRYTRVKKRLASFIAAIGSDSVSHLNIRVRSQANDESNPHFPCDIEMVWSVKASEQKHGAISVKGGLVDSCDALFERIGKKMVGITGAEYAAAFDFPALFGPAAYEASVIAVPLGGSTLDNSKYGARITRWRDNRWAGLLTSQGYLREIYPINFIREAHLHMPFQGQPLSTYMKRVGKLEIAEHNDKMYRWDVPQETLDNVRLDLEPSGLVLSSPFPPLQMSPVTA